MATLSKGVFCGLAALAALGLAACGPFQVGIERTPAASAAPPSAPFTAAAPAAATVAALQTANARLAVQVATLTAAQARAGTALPSALPPQPTATAPVIAVRITFPPGSASATVNPDLAAGPRAYVLKVLAGQHLILTADRDLQVQVTGPDGHLLMPAAARPQQWDFAVTQTGDQTITFSGAGRATVTIYVPPRG